MAYRFIEENQEEFGLRWLLRRMKIHPNAYYNYRKNSKAAYQRQKAEILEEIHNRNAELLIAHLKVFQKETSRLSKPFLKSINTLLSYQYGIRNALTYSYSNGPIEGINNSIKVLKRVAYGYRSFVRMRNRILITHNLLKPLKEYRAA